MANPKPLKEAFDLYREIQHKVTHTANLDWIPDELRLKECYSKTMAYKGSSIPFPRTVLKRRIVSCLERPLYVAFLGYGIALCNRIHRPWLHPKFDIGGGGPVLA